MMNERAHLTFLPGPLRERVRSDSEPREPASGEFVLYWMRTGVRAHQNPALDVALAASSDLDVPVFVYHPVSERHPYASDRIHTFILEGARAVASELDQRNIGYACHVERPGQRGRHLVDLAERAALVVTEEMPVEPLLSWTRTLQTDTDTPVWSVDTACVVPMRLVGQAYGRAYKFRNATEQLRDERIQREWKEQPDPSSAFVPARLPFEPIDIECADIAELVSQCDIDHAIGAVVQTPGGSEAGYARWRAFREDKLDYYHKTRNDPTRNGVSRLSPYLHFGHVSPFRVARQASVRGGDGADKYIDELITWRELSHTFCFYNRDRDLESVDILPDWARESLKQHQPDERPALYDWETLARGATEDDFWNLLQQSLLTHGELHNNVRMTWGKAFLKWAPDAQAALDMAFDLNHRYALDGRDPNSYQGILWCFGHFDRPFDEQPITGKVRPRDTGWHAGRVDVGKFRDQIRRPPVEHPPRVAVIGAGLSGLFCARTLRDHRIPVTVFDKGRGPGGRMSTRRVDDLNARFDHGAQYFTARDERFQRYVDAWKDAGIVAHWDPKIGVFDGNTLTAKSGGPRRFVARPGMNQVCRHLADPVDVMYRTRVGRIERESETWLLADAHGQELGNFDRVIVTAPPPQSADLLADVAPSLVSQIREVEMLPCWAVMVAFDTPLQTDFEGIFVNEGPLDWVSRNASKPGRSTPIDTWVLHATPEWTQAHIDANQDAVTGGLLEAFFGLLDLDERPAAWTKAHRWRFAKARASLQVGCLYDAEASIVACGDWSAGNRIEGAFLAGMSAAGRILGSISSDKATPQLQLI